MGTFLGCETCQYVALVVYERESALPTACANCGSTRLRNAGTAKASWKSQFYHCDECANLMCVQIGL